MAILMMRVMVVVFGISVMVVAAVPWLGTLADSPAMVKYHVNEGETYVMYIEDMSRKFRLWLAGTRCFNPLPPWVYDEADDSLLAAPDMGRSYRRILTTAEEIAALLRCG